MSWEKDVVECLDCGHRWDDLDPDAEKCECTRGLTMSVPASDEFWLEDQ